MTQALALVDTLSRGAAAAEILKGQINRLQSLNQLLYQSFEGQVTVSHGVYPCWRQIAKQN